MNYSEFLNQTLKTASIIANKNFGKVKGTTKLGDNNQVLTETDLKIGRFIISQIEKEFPEANIIDEEAGLIVKDSKLTFVVDPIDGTSNFANGVPTYGIMIGLLINEIPVAGGISLPFFDEILVAEKVKGSFLNGKKIKMENNQKLNEVLVAYGIDGHWENPNLTREEMNSLGNIVLNIRNLRTSNSVFDTVQVIKGSYGAVINRKSKIWDNVAQHIIIEQAGGIYTDYYGKKIVYARLFSNMNTNYSFIGASTQIYNQLQKIIRS